jgi:MoaA/NifB/PqqE/SkfB family radical SAM enzyme
MKLHINHSVWETAEPDPLVTLQVFITNRCNKMCKDCFYESRLGHGDMSMTAYTSLVDDSLKRFPVLSKVILLGGEPTLHPHFPEMLAYNIGRGLTTTIYTNGARLDQLQYVDLHHVSVRIGVLGLTRGEKNLIEIIPTGIETNIVYMLRNDNIDELMETAYYAEQHFNCRYFMISSIRAIQTTGDFWKDTDDTISMDRYVSVVQKFMDTYKGNLDIHIARRGIIEGDHHIHHCRFINVYPDQQMTLCPFDISKGIIDHADHLGRLCNKHSECLLQKLIYVKK